MLNFDVGIKILLSTSKFLHGAGEWVDPTTLSFSFLETTGKMSDLWWCCINCVCFCAKNPSNVSPALFFVRQHQKRIRGVLGWLESVALVSMVSLGWLHILCLQWLQTHNFRNCCRQILCPRQKKKLPPVSWSQFGEAGDLWVCSPGSTIGSWDLRPHRTGLIRPQPLADPVPQGHRSHRTGGLAEPSHRKSRSSRPLTEAEVATQILDPPLIWSTSYTSSSPGIGFTQKHSVSFLPL